MLDRALSLLRRPPFDAINRKLMRNRATVFVVHRERNDAAGVRGHSIGGLRRALHTLRRSGASFYSVGDLIRHARQYGEFPPNAVGFTIDDGFADQGRLAEVFLAEGIPVTMFLITGMVDGVTWPWNDRISLGIRLCRRSSATVELPDGPWRHSLATVEERLKATRSLRSRVNRLSQDDVEALLSGIFRDLGVSVPETPSCPHRPLSWDKVRELEQAGVQFAPHSVTHRIFSRLSDAAAQAEIDESRRRLSNELLKPLDILAWPIGRGGDFTGRDIRLAQSAGLEACFATDDDYATIDPMRSPDALYRLCRFGLPSSRTRQLQYASWIERAKQLVRVRGPGD